jgi:hypothetical protein
MTGTLEPVRQNLMIGWVHQVQYYYIVHTEARDAEDPSCNFIRPGQARAGATGSMSGCPRERADTWLLLSTHLRRIQSTHLVAQQADYHRASCGTIATGRELPCAR